MAKLLAVEIWFLLLQSIKLSITGQAALNRLLTDLFIGVTANNTARNGHRQVLCCILAAKIRRLCPCSLVLSSNSGGPQFSLLSKTSDQADHQTILFLSWFGQGLWFWYSPERTPYLTEDPGEP